jgi:hypothetical protein
MQTLENDVIMISSSSDKNLSEKEFDKFLVESIDEVLTSLGLPVKNSLYFHLQSNFEIEKNQIPQNIVEFSKILHKLFGFGASRLEIKIVEMLHSKLKVKGECPLYDWSKWIITEMSFLECIEDIRRSFESSSCSEK